MTDTNRNSTRGGRIDFDLEPKKNWIRSLTCPRGVKALLWALARCGCGNPQLVIADRDDEGGVEWLIEASKAQLAAVMKVSVPTIKRWLREARAHGQLVTITTSQGGTQRSVNVFHVFWGSSSVTRAESSRGTATPPVEATVHERDDPPPEPGSIPVRTGITRGIDPPPEPGSNRDRTGITADTHTSYPRTRALTSSLEREGALKAPSLNLQNEQLTEEPQPADETPAERLARFRERYGIGGRT